jgi:hypothetical protein
LTAPSEAAFAPAQLLHLGVCVCNLSSNLSVF